jgi:hypothetical protein
VRFLVIFAVITGIVTSPAFGMNDVSFDKFIKSREVVATLYFKSNTEDLTGSERTRLSDTINKLRELQRNGRMIRVEGFSSPEGDQEKNFRLSFFRARTVADLIEAKGLPAEVTLTGYGDLRAGTDDPKKERRVEIASYAKPSGIKRINIVKDNKSITPVPAVQSKQLTPDEQEIDSYRVDQAIRRKIDDKNRGIADQYKELLDEEASPDVSQTKKDLLDDLEHGYSQWRKSVDPDFSPKLSQKKTADGDLKRGYSQWKQPPQKPEASPDVTQVTPIQAPTIDALMIEQAIMEKIGVEPTIPSGSVTQVDIGLQGQ